MTELCGYKPALHVCPKPVFTEIERSVYTQSVGAEQGFFSFFFSLFNPVHGFFLDNKVARDDHKDRIHGHGMCHGPRP